VNEGVSDIFQEITLAGEKPCLDRLRDEDPMIYPLLLISEKA